MRGSETGPKGSRRRPVGHGEKPDLPRPGSVPWFPRAFGMGAGGGVCSGCRRGSPAASWGVTNTLWGRAGPRGERLGQPAGARGFLLGVGNPQGMPGPQPTPGCSMGRSHAVRASAPSHPHRRGEGNVGDVGLLQATSRASRRGCSGTGPRAPRLTSVLRPQQLRPRPLGSAPLESPRPFPSGSGGGSERGSVTPDVPPPRPGGYFGFGEKRKAAAGGRAAAAAAGERCPAARRGWQRAGKEERQHRPVPPAPAWGMGKRIRLTWSIKGFFSGAQEGLGQPPG